MTKEDYMRMPKERLAELLAERDNEPYRLVFPNPNNGYITPCYAPNGVCNNPFHDCINCPRMFGGRGTTTSNGTDLQPNKNY